MSCQRVVVTGMGVISALGQNTNEFWQALSSSSAGISKIEQVNCDDMRFKLGAEVKHYDGHDYFEERELQWLDRFAQFALISANEAIHDAKITKATLSNTRTAVLTGSCLGGQNTQDQSFHRLYAQQNKRANPNVIPNVMANAGASHIAASWGIIGPSFTISTACASSTHAIGQAFWFIRQGLVDRAIVGGSEAPFSLGHLKAWESLRVVAPDACRPFSKHRNGMILGEGGGMLVLESLSAALERQADIYAEVLGFGMSADATHITNPNASGQSFAIQAALDDAKLKPEEVHYINAHGTGTVMNDTTETTTIRSVFPNAEKHLHVSSTKAAHGHLLGATGSVESIATVLAIKHGKIPPTLNFLESDPECDLPLVVNHAKASPVDYALCSSFAFGGLNAVLAFGRYDASL